MRLVTTVLASFCVLGLVSPCAAEKSPDKYQVKFETTAGDIVIDVTRASSPEGSDRFYELVKGGFYNDCRFFRVVPNFVVQFGINGDPEVQKKYRDNTIKDDPVVVGNKRGFLTYAKTGRPNSRTTQLFINLRDNSFLDGMGFAAFGEITQGMDVVDKINSEYGERPNQGLIQTQGNEYLKKEFPNLDYIKKATIVEK